MESRSYKEIPRKPQNIFWIELRGNRNEFKLISEEFDDVENICFEGKLAYPPLAMAPPPYELFFSIVAAAGSLTTIADILHRYLRKKKMDEEKVISFRFDGKELTIKGDYSKEEILIVIQGFSKVAEATEISAISKERKKGLIADLNELRKNLEIYQHLVEVGESSKKRGKEWQSKLNYYREKRDSIKLKISVIESLLKD